MTRITEELIRRCAEHNNYEILSLEELSLHQHNIERIEHVDKWCRELKILYLQNNLIPRIENVGRLKNLQYLNLALNNIEVIENLEGCESLQKLDLTLNFVGRLSSVESLRHNLHLRELFLVGNPSSQFEGYRPYVVARLPQLKWLDGLEIGLSQRICAEQDLGEVRLCIQEQEQEYLSKRELERQRGQKKLEEQEKKKMASREKKPGFDGRWYTDINNTITDSDGNKETRDMSEEELVPSDKDEPCAFTPESRLEAYRSAEKCEDRENTKSKTPRKLVTKEGKILNMNEAKLDFALDDYTDENQIVLDLAVFRHMDTSLLDVDVQPTYIKVTVKGKVFQLRLPEEVKPDSSIAQRSQTTGHLLVIMPKATGELKPIRTICQKSKEKPSSKTPAETDRKTKRQEMLEVDTSKHSCVDLANIVCTERRGVRGPPARVTVDRCDSEGFEDDPDVPPLM